MSERTYTTRTGTSGRIVPFPSHSAALDARIRKVTVTDEGKLAVAVECELADEDTLEQVRNLLTVQRGPVSITFTSVQGELPL
ncbi:hypothetical protein [Thiococcus pfennigii]|uniref:hypothetical protein n=1 Tax=Thiococcus pfennigii TaxID=1057 RepID=UPI0019080B6A|nr:hypothetical protein [Thiococcus pfennigii]MBK1732770.1 hypothetical protein [Thiococcus pfennigii]